MCTLIAQTQKLGRFFWGCFFYNKSSYNTSVAVSNSGD